MNFSGYLFTCQVDLLSIPAKYKVQINCFATTQVHLNEIISPWMLQQPCLPRDRPLCAVNAAPPCVPILHALPSAWNGSMTAYRSDHDFLRPVPAPALQKIARFKGKLHCDGTGNSSESSTQSALWIPSPPEAG